jgi:hypothetical protein
MVRDGVAHVLDRATESRNNDQADTCRAARRARAPHPERAAISAGPTMRMTGATAIHICRASNRPHRTLHIEIVTEQRNAERVLLEDLFTLDQLL